MALKELILGAALATGIGCATVSRTICLLHQENYDSGIVVCSREAINPGVEVDVSYFRGNNYVFDVTGKDPIPRKMEEDSTAIAVNTPKEKSWYILEDSFSDGTVDTVIRDMGEGIEILYRNNHPEFKTSIDPLFKNLVSKFEE